MMNFVIKKWKKNPDESDFYLKYDEKGKFFLIINNEYMEKEQPFSSTKKVSKHTQIFLI